MGSSTLTSKGRIKIPKSIREYLGVHSGDQLEFIVDGERRVFISPKNLCIDDIHGMFERKKGICIEDMDKAVMDFLQKKMCASII